jgi:hypothetical protein
VFLLQVGDVNSSSQWCKFADIRLQVRSSHCWCVCARGWGGLGMGLGDSHAVHQFALCHESVCIAVSAYGTGMPAESAPACCRLGSSYMTPMVLATCMQAALTVAVRTGLQVLILILLLFMFHCHILPVCPAVVHEQSVPDRNHRGTAGHEDMREICEY